MNRVKGSPNRGLFGATLGFFVGFAAVSLFGPAANEIKDVLGLNAVEVGLLVAMPALSGSLLRVPFGAAVETTGGRKPFLILLALALVGMTGLTVLLFLVYPEHLTMGHYPVLLLLGLFSGCGIAAFSVGIAQTSYWFPQKRQGRALGAYAGIGNIAPGLFALFVPAAMFLWGLEGAYLTWLIFLAVGSLLYFFVSLNAPYFQLRAQGVASDEARRLAREHGQELFPAESMVESLNIAARMWRTWALVVIYFLTFGGFIALTAWLPTYWREYYVTGGAVAAGLTAMYAVISSTIRVPGGVLADRLGGERTLTLFLLATLAGAVMMTVARDQFVLSIVGIVVLAVGMGVVNAAVFKLVPLYVGEAVGGGAGWVGGLGAFGGFAIPPIMGGFVAMDGANGYATGFVIFIVLTAISLGLAYVLRRTQAVMAPAATGANPDRE